MQAEKFVYPQYGVPLVEAYDHRFEAVFIILHPFISVPQQLAWKVTRKYPPDSDIIAVGTASPWANVGRQTGLNSCARLNQALLTAGGSLTAELADHDGKEALLALLQSQSLWMPAQGRFEPLIQRDLLRVFSSSGYEHVIHVPEFPDVNPVASIRLAELQDEQVPFPVSGTLLAPDSSFLFTVDWDSFFTLFYGPRAFLLRMARGLRLEGFFATAHTDHAWFNYSMGCATVTLSPEHWQTV
ncbi:MAG: DUF2711 family protein [Acidobacteria bacterium]|nr:DUF2711 family protein [Acidobacteriota bacterium]